MEGYKKRIADEMLKRKLAGKGAVLIEGPKWCGKTTTAEQIAASVLYLGDPDNLAQNLGMASVSPSRLLVGDKPRLIDEWQVAPNLWDAVRYSVDHTKGHGLYILTGSSVPPDTSKIVHSGTGRFSHLTMRPMSLWESGESSGSVSIGSLFKDGKQDISGENPLSLDDIAFLVCRGGWPDAVSLQGEVALDQAFDYYDAIVSQDISRVDGVKRDESRCRRLMRSFARHSGGQATIRSIRSDMLVNDTDKLDEETVASYISALKKIFVVEDMQAWNPNLRSKTAIRASDNRYFIDSSIAAAALGIGPKDIINDLNTFGIMFETMCVRDLRIYTEALQGSVYHYRDSSALECDAVLHLRDGSYAFVEIKLGGEDNIEAAARNIKTLISKIDTDKMNEPAFSMILTAVGKYAYRRNDGIYVVPVLCLKD